MSNQRETFVGWAILEILGHRRLAGWVTEHEIAGHGMIRISIPNLGEDSDQRAWASDQFYSPQALYSIIPCGKDEALAIAESQAPQPVQEWDVRSLLPDIKEAVRREIQDEVRTEYYAKLENQRRRIPSSVDADYEDQHDNIHPPF